VHRHRAYGVAYRLGAAVLQFRRREGRGRHERHRLGHHLRHRAPDPQAFGLAGHAEPGVDLPTSLRTTCGTQRGPAVTGWQIPRVAATRKEREDVNTNVAPIVVGVDGSHSSLHAVDWAAQEAVAWRCPLRIIHAFLWPPSNIPSGPPTLGVPDAGLQHAAEAIVSDAADRARRAAPGLELSTDLPVCAPAAALIDASHDARLVVLGHRGLGGFTGLLVGSVGVQTAAHAACPVIVVREAAQRGPATGHVVVGVDGSEHSRLAVDFAFVHAARHGLDLVAVHAHQRPVHTPSGDADDPTRLLADALSGYGHRYPHVTVRHRIVRGVSAEVLVAESADAVLTVVGSRGRGGFTGLLLGSTSQGVLHHATGPVAIVRAHTIRNGNTTTAGQTGHATPRPPQAGIGRTAPPTGEPVGETGALGQPPDPSFGTPKATARWSARGDHAAPAAARRRTAPRREVAVGIAAAGA
jgi:nucleotide-binding universal stress UspA family protein